jgi:hypothetical protein
MEVNSTHNIICHILFDKPCSCWNLSNEMPKAAGGRHPTSAGRWWHSTTNSVLRYATNILYNHISISCVLIVKWLYCHNSLLGSLIVSKWFLVRNSCISLFLKFTYTRIYWHYVAYTDRNQHVLDWNFTWHTCTYSVHVMMSGDSTCTHTTLLWYIEWSTVYTWLVP